MIRLITLAFMGLATAAAAQERHPSNCILLAENTPGIRYIYQASFQDPVADDTVRLQYIAHATFLLQTDAGVSVATDFTGFLGATDFIPDIVTMNRAHSSHWTANPDPAIPNVLRGWSDRYGIAIDHYLELEGLVVRNVPTDIRSRFGDGAEANGNSIFVFEVAGLCIGHLGHLHHEPSNAQYAALGRLDVVMAAVDGGLTVDHPTMVRILKRLRSSIVVPMHWFGPSNLETFLAGMQDDFIIERIDGAAIEISLQNLPSRPTIMVLQPDYLRDDE
ncbi:MBL fold metallo-hydrolase [Parasulfitobacter algicola]|uniref:MBL fold metallo-hydrolase n=1 Tax=Parasulfitobacter algicola TaxID=2614809 RepID=A0ABX2IY47_9RHOB|nr:MBL fold metallo-hydrolase [Sulfitobacter algicola]NSX56047.1 MBL fold metallo-hydrolase [Sulfitobacter algicola]